jgi:hypothetical protein
MIFGRLKKRELGLSIVVIFHNMRREAKRTLYSLTPAYQKGVSVNDYEVLAIDSGSTEPLDANMVDSFGPNFHHLKINWEYPSPCRALNLGVAKARYGIVVCVIDGARILSPNILSRTLQVFRKKRNPFVYTLGMHLGAKVQNESMLEGYDQEVEDELLNTVPWRQDGYKLFTISSVASSSRKGFYSKLTESNCFALFKKTYKQIGGFDERFVSRGGGLANLDIFNRAMMSERIAPVMLLGEATFHQYHGGVATNVPLAEHPWASFSEEYARIRGHNYREIYRAPEYFGDVCQEALRLIRAQ